MDPQLLAEVFLAFEHEHSKKVQDLDDHDPFKARAVKIGNLFTVAVDFLRRAFPNQDIRTLMGLFWDLVGHKLTPVGIGPDVPSLSIAMRGASACIFCPHAWEEMVKDNPVLQMGAVVFVGSQAVDYYNGKLTYEAHKNVLSRAYAYEAEYLLTILTMGCQTMTEYQKGVLKRFGEGLRSKEVRPLLYTSKPFVAPS